MIHLLITSKLKNLLDNEKEIVLQGSQIKTHIQFDGVDFTLYAVHELFNLRLVSGHAGFEVLNSIFHLPFS
jgi:hypothetical protein